MKIENGKLIIETNIELKKKEYLSCYIEKGDFVVVKDEEIGRIEATDEIKRAFKNGRLPIVAVKDVIEENIYELTLVRWADLHGHTEYSLLDGAIKVSDKAKKTEYVSAITDHGNMFGFVAFYKAMEKENKHGIIGFEGYVESMSGEKNGNHMIFLAKNEVGYKNIVKLSSLAYENFHRHPHVSYEMLEEYSEGVIALSGCLGGEIPRILSDTQNNNLEFKEKSYKKAKEVALKLKSIFADDFYLEIQRHGIGQVEDLANEGLKRLSEELDIGLVATIDSHYVNEEDRKTHEILLCMQTGKTLEDEDRMVFNGGGYHIHNADEVDRLFKDIPEALNNTLEIAKKCSFELELGIINMPKFDVPKGHDADSYLREKVYEGFEERFGDFSKEERKIREERIDFELGVISDMDYSDYFLIVWDMISFAKEEGIYVGPGRGCFLPDTDITLSDGRVKKIKDIEIGDEVITHKGNIKKVYNTPIYDVEEKLIEIKAGGNKPIVATEDHKIYVLQTDKCKAPSTKIIYCKMNCKRYSTCKYKTEQKLDWVEAKDIKVGDMLSVPKTKLENKPIETIDLFCLDEGLDADDEYVWYKSIGRERSKVKRFIKQDGEFARLAGYFIGDGFSSFSTKIPEYKVGFGINANREDIVEDIERLTYNIFGIKVGKYYNENKTCISLEFGSRLISKFMGETFGDKAINKVVPENLMTSNKNILKNLLYGLMNTDRHLISNYNKISYSTTSISLMYQVQLLFMQLGFYGSISFEDRKVKNWNKGYSVTFSGKQLIDMKKYFPEIKIKEQAYYRNDFVQDNDYFYIRVDKLSELDYKGKVYDLSVEDDTSYMANGFAVHNSAIGALVSFCLNITDVDPIPYDLLFERFLNPERVSMPDIDIDFCYERRIEVENYVIEKYGSESVSKIVTINTLAARSVVRAVVKAKNLPYFVGDKIAKSIPLEPGMTLKKAYEQSPEFRDMYDSDSQAKKIIDISKQLEGLPRNTSVHACGLLISTERMDNYIPEFIVNRGKADEQRVSQVVMEEAEDLGILKMDLLGLRTMTVLSETVGIVDEVDYDSISLIDPYVYSKIGEGETQGVFQLESGGMRNFMSDLYSDVDLKIRKLERKYKTKGLYPSKGENIEEFRKEMLDFGQELFERLIAGISLYRPGPMDSIPNYIEGMNNPDSISYLSPELEPILEATYGVVVYQEQVIQIVQKLAGFSLGQADMVRRAMGKKVEGAMDIEKEKFIYGEEDKKGNILVEGCIRRGIKKEVAEEIWSQMEDFNKYAFNKSHSAGYAVLAVKTAWLKTYYPQEFMTATLNAHILNGDKANSYLSTCRSMGIPVLPPNINKSNEGFVSSEDGILFGLKAIRNIASMSERITRERKRGKFESLQDFAERMIEHEKIDKRVISSLIYSGAVDGFEGTRNAKIEVVDDILARARISGNDRKNGQVVLFDMISDIEMNKIETPEKDEFARRYMLDQEKEFTGYYLSGHPLDDYTDFFKEEDIVETDSLRVDVEFNEDTGEYVSLEADYNSGDWVKLAGIVTEIKILYTKKDQKAMAIFDLEDRAGTINCVVFPKSFDTNSLMLEEGNIVLIEGFFQNDERGVQVIVNSVLDLVEIAKANKKKDVKYVVAKVIDKSQINTLNKFINDNPGNIPMYIQYKNQNFKSKKGMKLDVSSLLKLRNIVDAESLNLVS